MDSILLVAVLLPTIEHGFYDAALPAESNLLAFCAVAFELVLIGMALFLVKRIAANDKPLHQRMAQ